MVSCSNLKRTWALIVVLFVLAAIPAYVGACAATQAQNSAADGTTATTVLGDGDYLVDVTLEGGSGRATVYTPAHVHIEHGEATATIVWSSPHYDYMIVGEKTYLPVSTDGNSTFQIPVLVWNEPFVVVGDTTAMSQPHEIEYQLMFDARSAVPDTNA